MAAARRINPLSLLATVAVLGVLLWPAVSLHLRALAAIREHPYVWASVSPFSRVGMSLLWRSLLLCLGVFLGTLTLGVPVGFCLARGPIWWRRLAAPLCAMALAIPPALAAAPYVSIALASASPQDGSTPVYFITVWVLSGCFFPLVAGATALAVRSIPPEEEEAALLLSGELTAWAGVLRARILPAALAGGFAAAALALWEMGAPDLLGWPTYSMHIYRNLAATSFATSENYQLPATLSAAIAGSPVLLLGIVLLAPAVRLLRSVEIRAAGNARREEPKVSPLAAVMCWPSLGILALFPVYLLYRFAAAVTSWTEASQVLTANDSQIRNTLFLPGSAALLITGIAFYLAASWRSWPRWAVRFALILAMLPLLVTPVVLGVALTEFWNQNATAVVYDTSAMTVVGYLNRFGPLVMAMALWSVLSVDEDMLRAARGLGATDFRLTYSVILPLLKFSVIGLAALTFSLCAGELSVTVLVQAPGGDTLPLPVFSLLHAGLSDDVAVLSLLQCALSGGAMVLAGKVLSRR